MHHVVRVVAPLAAIALLAGILLTGCSTGAQREAARIQSTSADATATAQVCFQQIADNPAYAPLASKTALGPQPNYTLQMLSDQTRPNKQEIALLYRVYGDVQECRKGLLDGAAKTHPLFLLALVESYSEGDKLWVQGTSGKELGGSSTKPEKTSRPRPRKSSSKRTRKSEGNSKTSIKLNWTSGKGRRRRSSSGHTNNNRSRCSNKQSLPQIDLAR